MKKAMLLPFAAAAALALSACSDKAQNETSEAAESIAADANATMGEAIDDVEAASDRAFNAAENGLDRAGNAIGNATDDAGRAADRGARETGEELEEAGNDLQNR
jgi:hypothetical protein